MEGKVNKGIYLKEEKDVVLLYYGRYQTSCINNPARCGPEGERVAPRQPLYALPVVGSRLLLWAVADVAVHPHPWQTL